MMTWRWVLILLSRKVTFSLKQWFDEITFNRYTVGSDLRNEFENNTFVQHLWEIEKIYIVFSNEGI